MKKIILDIEDVTDVDKAIDAFQLRHNETVEAYVATIKNMMSFIPKDKQRPVALLCTALVNYTGQLDENLYRTIGDITEDVQKRRAQKKGLTSEENARPIEIGLNVDFD